jgi:hypothetical protein
MSNCLYLTSIEKYYLNDDRPAFPNNFFCWLRFRGELDHDAAQTALEQTVERHPLSSVTAQQDQHGRLRWIETRGKLEFETVDRSDESTRLKLDRINPLNDNSMRLWKIRTPIGWEIVFQGHHAAVDGLGGLQLVADWMVAYSKLLSASSKAKLHRLDPALIPNRNRLGLLSRDFVSKFYCQPLALFGAGRFLRRKVAPLVPDSASLAGDHASKSDELCEGYPRFKSRTLTRSTYTDLQTAASQVNSTVHSLLMRDLFLAIHSWRKTLGYHRVGERLRLMIPMSIRTMADRRLPAANRATLVQIDRRDQGFDDPEYLLEMINQELDFIRRNKLEKTFLIVVRCLSAFPSLVRRLAMSKKCRATSALTNLGAPFERLNLPREREKIKIGNLVLEDFDLIVPLRLHTPAVFAVARYAGELIITMQFDPRLVADEKAESLIESFFTRLMDSAKTQTEDIG